MKLDTELEGDETRIGDCAYGDRYRLDAIDMLHPSLASPFSPLRRLPPPRLLPLDTP